MNLWESLFPTADLHTHRIVFEFGSGWGEFLTTFAQEHRQEAHLYVGIDLDKERCKRHVKWAQKAFLQPSHYKIIHGPISPLVPFIPHESVHKIFSLFPDPWPKRKHWKRRIIGPELLPEILRMLSVNGTWTFVTDMESYADHTEKVLLRLMSHIPDVFVLNRMAQSAASIIPRTKFERRCHQRGFQSHELVLSKKKTLQLPREEMPSVLFSIRERLTVGQSL